MFKYLARKSDATAVDVSESRPPIERERQSLPFSSFGFQYQFTEISGTPAATKVTQRRVSLQDGRLTEERLDITSGPEIYSQFAATMHRATLSYLEWMIQPLRLFGTPEPRSREPSD